MKLQFLMAGAAAATLSLAAPLAHAATAGAYAAPSQPVAYGKLDSYLKASPKKRAHADWGLGQTVAANTAPNPMVTQAPAPQPDLSAQPATPAPSPDMSATPAPAAPMTSPAPDNSQPSAAPAPNN